MPIDESKLKEYLRTALFQLCTEQPECLYFDVVFGGQKLEMCLSVVSATVVAYSEDEAPCPILLPS
jgi:hypothetical protein